MIATIHQPDFLPWFGLFRKIAAADHWIVLDHVENNPRDAAFWGRRVRILINGQPKWLSIPLAKPENGGVGVPITEMRINTDAHQFPDKLLKTVRMAYASAPHFDRYFPLVEAYFADPDPSMARRNLRFMTTVMAELGIETPISHSSDRDVESRGTQLLVDLLRIEGADTYLCGTGAGGYQEDDLFAEHGIGLLYNRFEHPVYPQLRTEEFHPGLSILDALFSVGGEAVASWLPRR